MKMPAASVRQEPAVRPQPNEETESTQPAAATSDRRRRRGRPLRPADLQRFLARLQSIPAVRGDVVRRVRGDLAAGTYVTPERLDAALDLLLHELSALNPRHPDRKAAHRSSKCSRS